MRWSGHAPADAPYTIDPKFVERVGWAVDQALANKLNVIVDFHGYDEMNIDPDGQLPRLAGLWEQVAALYKDRPREVYFELLNEPNGKLVGAKWNAAAARLLAVVRKTNPTRPVIVGPGRWNGIGALDDLEFPADDHNLIVTVHYYDPFEFTHQDAPWVKGSAKWKGREWTGGDDERAAVRKALGRAAEWGKTRDRPMFLGEFGAYQAGDLASRARWTRCVAREAEKAGLSWAYWEFCSGFGVYDPQAGAWREALKSALLE